MALQAHLKIFHQILSVLNYQSYVLHTLKVFDCRSLNTFDKKSYLNTIFVLRKASIKKIIDRNTF